MPPQKMNRTGGGRQAKKEKGEESGDGTRDGTRVQTPEAVDTTLQDRLMMHFVCLCHGPPPVPFVVML